MEPTTNQEVITPEPSAPTDNKKEGNGLKIGMVVCAILAVAGIGFGVYGMTRKPVETPTEDNAAELEAELSNVKQKYAVLQNYVKELEASGTEVPEEAKSATETAISSTFHNAIITPKNGNYGLTHIYETDNYYTDNRSISIFISNGEISSCTILKPKDYGKENVSDCQITGISGKISDVSQIGNTQMSWPYLGFLLEDGSVEYVSAFELTENFSAAVKGKLEFEFKKPVTNIVNKIIVSNPEGVGGYNTTAFYHNDGSLSIFNESMLAE